MDSAVIGCDFWDKRSLEADRLYEPAHWHIWPRYARPVVIDGESFTDPNFGHHYDKQARRGTTPEVRATIIKRLRESV